MPGEHAWSRRFDAVVNWCRKYSLWPMPFATACCGIELMAVGASRFDIARFGAEVMRFSPRQCDLMIVAGRVAMKMMPVLQRIWLQMPEPKWCISMGACACTGGVFDTYAVVQGVDRFIPVDVYIPGCPPRPEQILRALMDIQAKIQKGGTVTGRNGLPELLEREKYLAEKRLAPLGFATARRARRRGPVRLSLPARPGAARRRGDAMSTTRPPTAELPAADPARRRPSPRPSRRRPGRRRLLDLAVSRQPAALRAAVAADRAADRAQGRSAASTCSPSWAAPITSAIPGRTRARFEVHYVLRNLETRERLVVKAGVDDPDPTLPSAVPLWPGADWMEREVFDMFGIRFEGHPDLRRILMPEEFAAYPLRKDYPLRGRGERHNFPRLTRGES